MLTPAYAVVRFIRDLISGIQLTYLCMTVQVPTDLAGRVERLDADAVGADVDDAAHLEAVDIVRHPHSLPAVHARSSTRVRL